MAKYTPQEERYLERHYAQRGPTHCAKHLGRRMHAVAAKAHKMSLAFGVVKGYTPLTDLSEITGKEHAGIWTRAKNDGVLLVIGKHRKVALVPDAWADAYLERARQQAEGDEARAAGYLRIREAAELLGVGYGTVQRGLQGQGYLARLRHVRVVIGNRGSFNLHPADVERVRLELAAERAAAKKLESAKSLWLESGLNRSTAMSRLRGLPQRKVLKGGRIQTFVATEAK